jgi:hypothetical protein
LEEVGFEPTAFRLQSGRATTALHPHKHPLFATSAAMFSIHKDGCTVHHPGIEPGSPRWQRGIIPLNQWCSSQVMLEYWCCRWACQSRHGYLFHDVTEYECPKNKPTSIPFFKIGEHLNRIHTVFGVLTPLPHMAVAGSKFALGGRLVASRKTRGNWLSRIKAWLMRVELDS